MERSSELGGTYRILPSPRRYAFGTWVTEAGETIPLAIFHERPYGRRPDIEALARQHSLAARELAANEVAPLLLDELHAYVMSLPDAPYVGDDAEDVAEFREKLIEVAVGVSTWRDAFRAAVEFERRLGVSGTESLVEIMRERLLHRVNLAERDQAHPAALKIRDTLFRSSQMVRADAAEMAARNWEVAAAPRPR